MTLELPELLDIDWSNYAERIGNIYDVYLNEIYGKLSFFGKPVHCRIIPIYDNKHECFWHLMTQDFEKEKQMVSVFLIYIDVAEFIGLQKL